MWDQRASRTRLFRVRVSRYRRQGTSQRGKSSRLDELRCSMARLGGTMHLVRVRLRLRLRFRLRL